MNTQNGNGPAEKKTEDIKSVLAAAKRVVHTWSAMIVAIVTTPFQMALVAIKMTVAFFSVMIITISYLVLVKAASKKTADQILKNITSK